MTITRRTSALAMIVVLPLAAACARGDAATLRTASVAAAVTATGPAAGTYVDSILPPEEELRRFRAGVGAPAMLEGGRWSRDALVHAFVRAVEHADTAAVRRMIVSRAEFGYLYYPFTGFTRPPRRMSPALLWFLTMQESEKGIGRLFQRRAGQPLGYVSSSCAARPRVEGGNRLWDRCTVTLRRDGRMKTERLFGTIIERDGQFKFLSYKNEY